MKYIYTIVIICLIVILGAIVMPQGKKTTNEVVTFAGLFHQTGFASFAGEASRNGFILALEDAGLDPRNFVIEDGGSDIVSTVSSAKKLVEVDGVNVIIGPEWDEFSEAVMGYVQQRPGTLVISPWVTSEDEWVSHEGFFSMMPSERVNTTAILEDLSQKGYTKVAIISTQNAWSQGVVRILHDQLGDEYAHIQVVADIQTIAGMSDYRTDIAKLRMANPGAIIAPIAGGAHPDTFVIQMHEQGFQVPIYMNDGSVGAMDPSTLESGRIDGVAYATLRKHDKKEEFRKKYKERFGIEPSADSAATTYDAVSILLEATSSGARTTSDITEYFAELKEYDGFSGVISFDKSGLVSGRGAEIRVVGE